MYDIVGWFGASLSKDSPNALINTMLGPPAETQIQEEFTFASKQVGRIGASDSVCLLLCGYPVWQNQTLADEALRIGDAKLLARLWHTEGLATFNRIGGSFALALYDRARNEGVLAIDRMGVCPMAYAEVPQGLIFSTDLDVLLRHPSIATEPDPQALFAYLYFHTIPAPLSIYRGVRKLLPGQCLIWRQGALKLSFYWQPDFTDDVRAEAELALELRTRLRQAVSACIKDPLLTGAFLSGGLDSSTVVGFLRELAPQSAAAFTIGFTAQGYDEMEYARASACHFGVPLHEYYLTPHDVIEAAPKIAAFYDEPFGNASAIPAYYCARLAREHGKTCLLAGDGGDELFAGNTRYAKQKLLAFYDRLPSWLRTLAIEPLVQRGGFLPGLSKLKSYVWQAKIPLPERLETYNFLHRTPLSEIFESDFLATVYPDWPIDHLREIYCRPKASMLKRMLWLDWKITLADNDLRKVNRTCALAGVEVRYPMLQEPVVQLAATIPDHFLMRGLELRSFYRRALKDFLAPKTLNKSKHGFGLPFGVWLKSYPDLQELAYTSLDHPALSGIIRRDYIARLKQAHLSEHASYYGVMIYVLMMWAQWAEHH
ncbi:MAG: asparagine synthase C-terminal domain-containing protein [Methylohalobius sp.]|nr:asparagine synthase C-terminal domain-containing protein [Methylohalobius sp.]